MDTPIDSRNITVCIPDNSKSTRQTAEAARRYFMTLSDEQVFGHSSSDDSTFDSNSDHDLSLPATSAVARERDASASPPAKRGKESCSEAQKADAESISNWRSAQVNEEVGRPTSSFDGSGILLNLGHDRTPMSFFLALLTTDILDSLIQSINGYADMKLSQDIKECSRLHEWTPIGRYEMYKFLATIISMGMQPKPEISDYWTTTFHMQSPFFKHMFSRNQFQLIYNTMLHVSKSDRQDKSEIEPFVNQLLSSFQTAFYPFTELSIGEMVIGYKGRWNRKQYNTSKPSRYHIKVFGLCDSITGYVFNLLIDFGADTSYNHTGADSSSQGVKVFHTLLQPVKTSHHIYANRFYTSLSVIEYLQSKGHNYTGTLDVNHHDFPPQLKTMKMAPKEAIYHVKDGENKILCVSSRVKMGPKVDIYHVKDDEKILCVSWRDRSAKNPHHVLTTYGKANTVPHIEGQQEVEKPDIINLYNMCVNGCDRADQKVSYYGFHVRKTVKWWKKIFTWILEVTQVNAHTLYLLSEQPAKDKRSLACFKHQLIEGLISLADSSMIPGVSMPFPRPKERRRAPGPATERYRGNHLVDFEGALRSCVYCSRPDRKVRTKFYCTKCSDRPHLCPRDCFRKYHEPL